MQDILVRMYSLVLDDNLFFKKIKYYSFQRFSLRLITIIFLPMWFKVTNLFVVMKLNSKQRDLKTIVSLTTFPPRISKIWLVIECLMRQSYVPDKIILWLSKDQFPDKSRLPKRLLKLQSRGLEIVLCEGDLRSHKKYYYALENYPDAIIVTVDDDVIYPSVMLQELIDENTRNPMTICCHRAIKIKTNKGAILPYKNWEYINDSLGPAFDVFLTGCGGVLYPPNCLHSDVLKKEIFMKHCLYADDVWLYTMALLKNTKIKKIDSELQFIPILNKDDITLTSVNVDQNFNDKQLNDVRKYYEVLNVDPFKKIFN